MMLFISDSRINRFLCIWFLSKIKSKLLIMSIKIYSKHTEALLHSFEYRDLTSSVSSDIKSIYHDQS